MVERFLRYSLEHGRRITLMVTDEKGIRRMHVTVTRIGAEEIGYMSARSRKEQTLPLHAILFAAYGHGDDGDTLKHEADAAANGENVKK